MTRGQLAGLAAAVNPAGAGAWLLAAAGALVTIGAALAVIGKAWGLMRRVGRFLDVWEGTPETPGVPARIAGIEKGLGDHLLWHASQSQPPAGLPVGLLHHPPNGVPPQ